MIANFKRALVLSLGCFACLLCHAQTTYFPKNIFAPDQKLDHFVSDWYSQQLTALHEPSLFQEANVATVHAYRFLWLRTFHHPVAIRLDIDTSGNATLTTKIASGAGGYDPGKLTQDLKRSLTKDQTQLFLSKIDQAAFWSLPATPKQEDGCDGSEWIIEGVKGGKYHLATRWTPENGPIHDLGLFAIQLAGLTIPAKELY